MSQNSRFIANLIPKPKDNLSIMDKLALLPKEDQEKALDEIIKLKYPDKGYEGIKYDWELTRRADQWIDVIPDPNWKIGIWLAGRGFGKTRVISEITRHFAEQGKVRNITLIGRTANDVTGTMLHGPSGIINISPPWFKPHWSPTYKTLEWPNGVVARYFSAEEPESLRGPQHELLVCDEICAWNDRSVWDMALFGLRLGTPKAIIATTPKPTQLLLDIIGRKDCYTITGSSYENSSNIDISMLIESYQNTRLGRQELEAEILWENEDALWNSTLIEKNRVKASEIPELIYIVVGIDPAVSMSGSSAETGLSVVGYGIDGHLYVLFAEGYKYSPNQWADKALQLYDYYKADKIIAEVNNGGDLVISNINNVRPLVPVKKVHATKGKVVRAEPIATLTELGKIHHVGYLGKLEDQLCNLPPTDKKTLLDVADSFVWACTALMEMTATGQYYQPSVGPSRPKLLTYMDKFQ